MKTKLFIPFLALSLLFSSVTFANTNYNNDPDPEKDKVLISVLNYMLTRGHFVEKRLNDDFSVFVFDHFIDGLDPSKRYFTQKDIQEFSKYKYLIDNQLKKSNIDFYKLVYGKFLNKIKTAKKYYGSILKQPFNYKKKEVIDVDFSKAPFAANENELIDYWRKQLKLQTIDRIQEQEELQDLEYKKDKSYKKKSFSELEKIARGKVMKSMDELYIRIEELEHEDWFSTFLNSVVGAFDPHTTYLAPRAKDRFDQEMSGKLEGIGARLQKRGIYTHIVNWFLEDQRGSRAN